MILLLFVLILTTPFVCLIGFIMWLMGMVQSRDDNAITQLQLLGKKVMWYALLAFMIGTGSCWGMIGLGSLIGYLSNIFN